MTSESQGKQKRRRLFAHAQPSDRLQSEDKFSFVLQPVVATWTPTIDFNITVELIGKTIKTFVP